MLVDGAKYVPPTKRPRHLVIVAPEIRFRHDEIQQMLEYLDIVF